MMHSEKKAGTDMDQDQNEIHSSVIVSLRSDKDHQNSELLRDCIKF